MRYLVTLERGADGGYLAWVHDLPGCVVRGATRDEVVQRLAQGIAEFRAWLREHGEKMAVGSPQVEVAAEHQSLTRAADADTEILLDVDRAPLTVPAWNRMERWLGYCRSDVIALLQQTPPDLLDARPPGSVRSIREHLVHIGVTELLYALWTFDLTAPEGLREMLRWTRRVALRRMRALARSDRGTVTHAQWSDAPRPEPWTARKAARRMVWHERLHLRAARRLRDRLTGDTPGATPERPSDE
jgi:predicted RNase H-like HicB family nuclease